MKKVFMFAVAVCLLAPLGMAQDNEVDPNLVQNVFEAASNSTYGALGDLEYTYDLEAIIANGDNGLLGIEYDETTDTMYVTGRGPSGSAANHLYRIDNISTAPAVTTLNQPQKDAWGWRDLAWDGTYLYVGDVSAQGWIIQIDPATGAKTGTQWGPFNGTLQRAISYNPKQDNFWCGQWSEPIRECFKNGTFNTYTISQASIYGMGVQHKDVNAPMLWCHGQSGGMDFGEVDITDGPNHGVETGVGFNGTFALPGAIAGGAGVYESPTVAGKWEIVGLGQATPDACAGFDLETIAPPFKLDNTEIKMWQGGTVTFQCSQPSHAGRQYAIFGGFTGTTPGITLPGGVPLPLNFDFFTDLFLAVGLPSPNIGNLDPAGAATGVLVIPPDPNWPAGVNLDLYWAWASKGKKKLGLPWYGSPSAKLTLIGPTAPPSIYFYDDGTSENAYSWVSGGDVLHIHSFNAGVGDTLTEVSTVWGMSGSTSVPTPGNPCTYYVFEDPNSDGNCGDAFPLYSGVDTIKTSGSDTFDVHLIPGGQAVNDGFFIGACYMAPLGGGVEYPAAVDSSNSGLNYAWLCGDNGNVGGGHTTSPPGPLRYEMSGSVGAYVFLLRAK